MSRLARFCLAAVLTLSPLAVRAGVGDPQVRTDHPWYPGELACSTFARLAETQAEQYRRVTGETVRTDEQKALASWLWRNTHYTHGEEGAQDLWGAGFTGGGDLRSREYWTGLFAHGFGLCGTTHSQWTAEMEVLLGHGRGRGLGVAGHNSFEAYLTGGPYGAGKWVLLDHDVSTVVYDPTGRALLSIPEVRADLAHLTDRNYKPEKQHGWLVSGLDPGDGQVYSAYNTAEYLAGYAGPPPITHLRRGESLRRYPEPGLDDGKTFAFWGRNYRTGGIPGPERSQTWVNQPDAMRGSRTGTGYRPGQARFANAVYRYEPDFASGDHREGTVGTDDRQVTFEFRTPYVIAATPPNESDWGVYEPGCRNGLVLRGKARCAVSVSTDSGATWQDCGPCADGLDLTDRVKGRQHYLIRFHAAARDLAGKGLVMTTVCQANTSVLPRLKDGGSAVSFLATGRAVVSAGPDLPSARHHLIEGGFPTPKVTLALATPRGEPVVGLHAAAHVLSGNPPDPAVRYQIEFSNDAGASWLPLVHDWTVPRRGQEPNDFWSQSLCWGAADLPDGTLAPIRVRFRNDGGKAYARGEAHLTYRVAGKDATEVTFAWDDDRGPHRASHSFPASDRAATWEVPTGRGVRTRWVEFRPVAAPRS